MKRMNEERMNEERMNEERMNEERMNEERMNEERMNEKRMNEERMNEMQYNLEIVQQRSVLLLINVTFLFITIIFKLSKKKVLFSRLTQTLLVKLLSNCPIIVIH